MRQGLTLVPLLKALKAPRRRPSEGSNRLVCALTLGTATTENDAAPTRLLVIAVSITTPDIGGLASEKSIS